MLRSDNDMTLGQRHTIAVSRQTDGTYEAKVLNTNVKVDPVRDRDQSTAIRMLNDKLHLAHIRGEVE